MFRQSFSRIYQNSHIFRKSFNPRYFSFSRYARKSLFSNFQKTLIGGVVVGGIGSYYLNSGNHIWLDSELDGYVQPETKVNPFPKVLEKDGEELQLLGIGVRAVSFLSIHVYAVGIYIPQSDIIKLPFILNKEKLPFEELQKLMLDPESGSAIISKLLNSGVNLCLRIVPVRPTDFGHLKDGFIRTIMAHPRFKTEGNTEEFGEGMNQLKRIFARKRHTPKNRILHLTRDDKGVLRVDFFDAESESKATSELLGTVTEPLVTELLFLQYLSGKQPSSEGARKSSIETLAKLASK